MVSEKYKELRDAEGLLRVQVTGTPKLENLDPTKVVINRKRNRRDEVTDYEKTNPEMMSLTQSVKLKGIVPGYYPVVHREADDSLEVLIGHRRLTACIYAGLKSVPCIVISGLSEEEKLMVIYGSNELQEGDIGQFKEVREFIAIGLSRKAIAEQLNWRSKSKTGGQGKLNTNLVQYYAELSAMPQEVIDAWLNQKRGKEVKDFPPLSSTVVRELYAANAKDEALFEETKGLEGSVTFDGLEFRKELAKVKDTGKTTKATEKKNGPTQKELLGYASNAKNNVFKMWILGVAGKEGINFGPLLGKIDEACNLVYPNPKPADAPKEVEDLFKEEVPSSEVPSSEVPSSEVPLENGEVISEGVTTPILTERETVKNRSAKRNR